MTRLGHSSIRISFYGMAVIVLVAMFFWQFEVSDIGSLIGDYWYFFMIGVFAATVANSTGAGGGIIFLPAFIMLGLTLPEALGTSFAIQCFGMTSGTLTWLALARIESHGVDHSWEQLNTMLLLTVPASAVGLLSAQQLMPHPPFDVHHLFSGFSISIGIIMLYRLMHHYRADEFHSPTLTGPNKLLIIVSCFVGGMITWWLSVGVGEILAIVLLMLGYNIRFAVTIAVTVSAVTVWLALPYYLILGDTIDYKILLFAGPAALIGGFIARHLAIAISALRLKILLSLWIILSGFVYIFVK
jgi:uncharacterized membrane protein YfcA